MPKFVQNNRFSETILSVLELFWIPTYNVRNERAYTKKKNETGNLKKIILLPNTFLWIIIEIKAYNINVVRIRLNFFYLSFTHAKLFQNVVKHLFNGLCIVDSLLSGFYSMDIKRRCCSCTSHINIYGRSRLCSQGS